jgi:hypothetical protein
LLNSNNHGRSMVFGTSGVYFGTPFVLIFAISCLYAVVLGQIHSSWSTMCVGLWVQKSHVQHVVVQNFCAPITMYQCATSTLGTCCTGALCTTT